MCSTPKSQGKLGLALAVLSLCCLPVPAFSDEFKYLPDNAQIIASVDVTAGAKTKTVQEFKKMMATPFGGKAPKETDDVINNFVSKIARVTVGVVMAEDVPEFQSVMTAVKPITAAEVKAMNKPLASLKNFAYKEIKHGPATIYLETYQKDIGKGELSDVLDGEAFYVADGKYIVLCKPLFTNVTHARAPKAADGKYGANSRQVAALKKIIDRNKAATLSPIMQAGLKDAGFNNMANVVVDLQNMPAKNKEFISKELINQADIKAIIDKVQSLTIKMNEPGKFKMSATLACSDTATPARQDRRRTHAGRNQGQGDECGHQEGTRDVSEINYRRPHRRQGHSVVHGRHKVTVVMEVEPEIAVLGITGFGITTSQGAPGEVPKLRNRRALPQKRPRTSSWTNRQHTSLTCKRRGSQILRLRVKRRNSDGVDGQFAASRGGLRGIHDLGRQLGCPGQDR